MDRLGSVVMRGWAQKYFPYGEEPSTTRQNREKFATYYRDDTTALDYANQRYYGRTIGRFLTADPYMASGGPADPQSGNRYSYVQNDPVNFNDSSGLASCPVGAINCIDVVDTPLDGPMGDLFGLLYSQFRGDFPEALAVIASPRDRIALMLASRHGGHESLLMVKSLSKAGNNQILIENTFRWVRSALDSDPDCAGWLTGAQGYIDMLLSQALTSHGDFKGRSDIAAFTGTAGTNVPAGYAAIVFNDKGAFFHGGFTDAGGVIQGGTDLARVFIALHELGHGLEIQGYESDLNDSEAGARNDAKVLKNCNKTLNRLR